MNDQERDKILEKIDSNVSELMIWKSALDVRCKVHRDATNSLQKEIYGNPYGVKHLVSENAKQIEKLVNCKTNIRRWRDFFIIILRYLVIAGIMGFAAWVIKVFKLL